MNTGYSFSKEDLQSILDILNQSYRCVGPQIRDQALVFTDLSQLSQLPLGYIDKQNPGEYHLEFIPDNSDYFSITTGPQGLKPWLFKPYETLWQVTQEAGKTSFRETITKEKPIAFMGARACDLAALNLQDQHFIEGKYPDPYYAQHRKNLLIIAVNCHHSTPTCFCVSSSDGPEVTQHFDLLLSELEEVFLLQSGSAQGEKLLAQFQQHIPMELITAQQEQRKVQRLQNAAKQLRQLPDRPVAQLLNHRLNHQQWDNIAERCLACGNCTMVCPSCFCHSEHDKPALNLESSEHIRQWDSCFSSQHAYISSLNFRKQTHQQYRQWLTHKFSFWHEQYGRSGCTGCGRCISWCPVGIDITQELALLCEQECCHVD